MTKRIVVVFKLSARDITFGIVRLISIVSVLVLSSDDSRVLGGFVEGWVGMNIWAWSLAIAMEVVGRLRCHQIAADGQCDMAQAYVLKRTAMTLTSVGRVEDDAYSPTSFSSFLLGSSYFWHDCRSLLPRG